MDPAEILEGFRPRPLAMARRVPGMVLAWRRRPAGWFFALNRPGVFHTVEKSADYFPHRGKTPAGSSRGNRGRGAHVPRVRGRGPGGCAGRRRDRGRSGPPGKRPAAATCPGSERPCVPRIFPVFCEVCGGGNPKRVRRGRSRACCGCPSGGRSRGLGAARSTTG